jgi:hypothetical protein
VSVDRRDDICRRWLNLLVAGGLTIVAVGCGSGYTVTTTQELVALEGRLSSGRVGGVECDWLTDSAGRRYDVFWPDGWQAVGRPVRLLDLGGRTVAEEGDLLRVRGPSDGIGESLRAQVFSAPSMWNG